jgi:hypothetical protein
MVLAIEMIMKNVNNNIIKLLLILGALSSPMSVKNGARVKERNTNKMQVVQ